MDDLSKDRIKLPRGVNDLHSLVEYEDYKNKDCE